ncbi:MAG: hypothetical protein ACREP7_14020 [Lysobacter sp.]
MIPMKTSCVVRSTDRIKFLPALLMPMLFAGQAMANSYPQADLESKVANSDWVAIAEVASVSSVACGGPTRCATLRARDVLKGEAKGEVVVLFGGPISESNPLCCEVGATYLFLLKKNAQGYFESVNGPFGIYKITK